GTDFRTIHNFTHIEGFGPYGLVLSGNLLFGTAQYGGSWTWWGTLFRLSTDGSKFTTLHNFTRGNDGGYPCAGLALSNNVLYGTGDVGGTSDSGVVFAISTAGTNFVTLHSFTALEGANPIASVTLSDNVLYGSMIAGGGTIFKVNTDGNGFT